MKIFGLNYKDWSQAYRLFRTALRNRFLGSRMGLLWAVLNPLMMLFLYIFVFGFLMKSSSESRDSLEYVRWFICGFTPWMAFSDGIVYSTISVTNNIQLVKTFPMKTELLPISHAAMGAPQLLVGIVVVLILSAITGAWYSIHILWLLFLIPLILSFLAGLGFFLSSLNVFVRDISQIIGTLLMFVMFFTPIFYDATTLPKWAYTITFFNPVYQIVNNFRLVLIDHTNPNFWGLGYLLLLTLVLWSTGLPLFRRLKGYFESAL